MVRKKVLELIAINKSIKGDCKIENVNVLGFYLMDINMPIKVNTAIN